MKTNLPRVAVGLAGLLLTAAAPAWQPSSPSAAVTERIKRDVARCKKTENLETCDDAVRWVPSDPVLLVAFGDALMRTQHPADALRQYQRAAALAPKMPGVGAKISAAEARVPTKHAPNRVVQASAAAPAHAAILTPKPAKPVLAQTRSVSVAIPASHPAAKAPLARNSSPEPGQSFSNDAADSHSH